MADGRLAELKRGGEVADADGLAGFREDVQDLDPGWVAERLVQRRELVGPRRRGGAEPPAGSTPSRAAGARAVLVADAVAVMACAAP